MRSTGRGVRTVLVVVILMSVSLEANHHMCHWFSSYWYTRIACYKVEISWNNWTFSSLFLAKQKLISPWRPWKISFGLVSVQTKEFSKSIRMHLALNKLVFEFILASCPENQKSKPNISNMKTNGAGEWGYVGRSKLQKKMLLKTSATWL